MLFCAFDIVYLNDWYLYLFSGLYRGWKCPDLLIWKSLENSCLAKAGMVFLLCSSPIAHLLEWNNFRHSSFYTFFFLFQNLLCPIQSHLFTIWICMIQDLRWCFVCSRAPRTTKSGWVHAFATGCAGRSGLLCTGTWLSFDLGVGICNQSTRVFARDTSKDQGRSPPTFSLKALFMPKEQEEVAAGHGSLVFFKHIGRFHEFLGTPKPVTCCPEWCRSIEK